MKPLKHVQMLFIVGESKHITSAQDTQPQGNVKEPSKVKQPVENIDELNRELIWVKKLRINSAQVSTYKVLMEMVVGRL